MVHGSHFSQPGRNGINIVLPSDAVEAARVLTPAVPPPEAPCVPSDDNDKAPDASSAKPAEEIKDPWLIQQKWSQFLTCVHMLVDVVWYFICC